jgi:hypothetical protein
MLTRYLNSEVLKYKIVPGFYKSKSRDSSIDIALGYGLDDRCSRVRFPAGAGNFSLYHRVQNGSGAYPALSSGYHGPFPWG